MGFPRKYHINHSLFEQTKRKLNVDCDTFKHGKSCFNMFCSVFIRGSWGNHEIRTIKEKHTNTHSPRTHAHTLTQRIKWIDGWINSKQITVLYTRYCGIGPEASVHHMICVVKFIVILKFRLITGIKSLEFELIRCQININTLFSKKNRINYLEKTKKNLKKSYVLWTLSNRARKHRLEALVQINFLSGSSDAVYFVKTWDGSRFWKLIFLFGFR